MMSDAPLQVTVVSNSPGPNQSDFYDALSSQPSLHVALYYCATGHVKWRNTRSNPKYPGKVLVNLNPWTTTKEFLHCNPGVFRLVSGTSGLVMVQGYAYPTALATLWSCIALRRRFVLWGEMIDRNPRLSSRLIKDSIVWPAIRRADAILTMGPRGKRSYQRIGVDSAKIHDVPYSCNLSGYLQVGEKRTFDRKSRYRIVVTGQLIRRKRIDIALLAFSRVADQHRAWDLVMAGDGPLRGQLEASIAPSLRDRVQFRGFVPKSQQAELYADADIFLLTSAEDGWGMVIPEAMASGLPVVCTSAVESAQVLLEDGTAGILIPPNNPEACADALSRLMADGELRRNMGSAGVLKARTQDSAIVAEHCASVLRRIAQGS